ncbi:MAG: copper amine oxidase N-terminal domain-containing protein [Tindallia sp. MSAO_Bac2]|nr:MAG: copper amine oxidase N-terminal domain-containing protein [Tindallia sp. MSAO_Bac2]
MKKAGKMLLLSILIAGLIFGSSVSAASENRVTDEMTAGEFWTIPMGATYLSIKDEFGDISQGRQQLRLELENAEWAPINEWFEHRFRFYEDNDFSSIGTADSVNFQRVTSNRMDIDFSLEETITGFSSDEIRIPLIMTVQEVGEATVRITPLHGSAVSGGEYVVAEVVESDLRVTIDEPVSFGPGETAILSNIVLDETKPQSLELTDAIEIRLPRDFQWAEEVAFTVTGSGGFQNQATVDTANYGGGTRDLAFTLEDIGIERRNIRALGTITLEGLGIYSESRTFGDVSITFGGDLENHIIEGADYIDYDVTMEIEEEPRNIVSGRLNTSREGGFSLPTLIMEEEVLDSWVPGRSVTLSFEDWIKIMDVDGVSAEDFTPGDSSITFTPQRTGNQRMYYELDMDITVQADREGPIEALITSRGLATDYTVEMGEAVRPVTLQATSVPVLVGSETVEPMNILVAENLPRGLQAGTLELKLSEGTWQEEVDVSVESGDLELGEVTVEDEKLLITISQESFAPSVIQINQAMVDLPEEIELGIYTLSAGGDAMVDNNTEEAFMDVDDVDTINLFEVVEKLGPSKVQFTVDSTTYLVDGEEVEMDVAPFIQNDRLMVPVAHVAIGLGYTRDDIHWDGDARTVTLTTADKELMMTIGSRELLVDGETVEMDAEAEIRGDRSFVPISRFAEALGIPYSWDGETRTATFEPN